jgi:N-acylneuraminate cytidylyltransferase
VETRAVTLAIIIPARGGSQGIPRKNMQPVGDAPLLVRAVNTALEAAVGEVWVSTDDADYAAAAEHLGARVHIRPPHLATNEASSESAVIDCVRDIYEEPTHTILMQCTSPFTSSADVRRVAQALEAGAECVVTLTPFYGLLWNVADNGVACEPVPGIDGHSPRKRRQDRHPPWLETGALYGMRTDLLLATGSRFCGKVSAVMVPKYRTPEIDDAWDLAMCSRMADWAAQQAPGSEL